MNILKEVLVGVFDVNPETYDYMSCTISSFFWVLLLTVVVVNRLLQAWRYERFLLALEEERLRLGLQEDEPLDFPEYIRLLQQYVNVRVVVGNIHEEHFMNVGALHEEDVNVMAEEVQEPPPAA